MFGVCIVVSVSVYHLIKALVYKGKVSCATLYLSHLCCVATCVCLLCVLSPSHVANYDVPETRFCNMKIYQAERPVSNGN